MSELDNLFNDDLTKKIQEEAEKKRPASKPVVGSKGKPEVQKRDKSDEPEEYEPSPGEAPEFTFASKMAIQEFADIMDAWEMFHELIQSTAVGQYLDSGVEGFAKYMKTFEELVTKKIDPSKLTVGGLEGYKRLAKKRAQVLADVFNKYADKFKEEEDK